MNIESHLGLYSMHPFNFMNVTRGLEALMRMLFSGHRLVCVRRVRPGNEINENGEWFFCKGKRKP